MSDGWTRPVTHAPGADRKGFRGQREYLTVVVRAVLLVRMSEVTRIQTIILAQLILSIFST